jgi:hypothetical protein
VHARPQPGEISLIEHLSEDILAINNLEAFGVVKTQLNILALLQAKQRSSGSLLPAGELLGLHKAPIFSGYFSGENLPKKCFFS